METVAVLEVTTAVKPESVSCTCVSTTSLLAVVLEG